MKKFFAVLICLASVLTFTLSVASADTKKVIDYRELGEYGQPHYYLGEPVEQSCKPNSKDAHVADGEYAVSYEYKKGDKCVVISDADAKAKILDNEWVRVYLSYDEKNLYTAIETKDKNYIKGKDGVAFNLGFRDEGSTVAAISRYCFDIQMHEEAEEGDTTTLKARCRYFMKKDNGEWENDPATDGMLYINDISLAHDDQTDITTVEVAFDLYYLMKEVGNELPLNEVRIYFIPFVYMYGESNIGAGDVVCQGILWNYLHSSNISNLKPQFLTDYPGITYWPSFVPNIVHFCSDPKFTTTASTTVTTTVTTAEITEIKTTTQEPTQGVIESTSTNADATNDGGCSGELAISVLPLVGALCVAFVKYSKKEEIV